MFNFALQNYAQMNTRNVLFIFFLLLTYQWVFAQRSYKIEKVDALIDYDGLLNEEVWKTTEIADSFTVNSPVFWRTIEVCL
jgi:hypothetical protein